MVLIFILIYLEWRDTENQQFAGGDGKMGGGTILRKGTQIMVKTYNCSYNSKGIFGDTAK